MAAVPPKPNSFSTIQYNTTVKQLGGDVRHFAGFSTIQYNTTVKPQL